MDANDLAPGPLRDVYFEAEEAGDDVSATIALMLIILQNLLDRIEKLESRVSEAPYR